MPSPGTTTDRLLDAAPDDPSPLDVSTASKTKLGGLRLTFRKAAGAPDVECTRIAVTIPVGETTTDLTGNPQTIDYKHSSSKGSWGISSPDRTTFVCTPPGPARKFLFDDTAHFTLILTSIAVGRLPGDAPLVLTATLTDQPDQEDWTVPITKAVDDFFFFRAFSCEQPQVPNPGTATLRWEGSELDTEYWLSYDGRPPERVTGQSTQVAGLTDTTTFVLDARSPDPDTGAYDRHHYLSTTVTVKEPTIVARELTAKRISVPRTLTADSADRTTILHGPATFKEDVTVMAKLIVNGSITSSAGTVTVDAGITTGSRAITGGAITGSSVSAGSGTVTGGAITGTSLSAGTGAISGGAITGSSVSAGSGTVTGGAITGTSLSAGSGAIRGGAITGTSVNAGSGSITTSGSVTDGGSPFLRRGSVVRLRNGYHTGEGLNEDNKASGGVSLKSMDTNNLRWLWHLDQ